MGNIYAINIIWWVWNHLIMCFDGCDFIWYKLMCNPPKTGAKFNLGLHRYFSIFNTPKWVTLNQKFAPWKPLGLDWCLWLCTWGLFTKWSNITLTLKKFHWSNYRHLVKTNLSLSIDMQNIVIISHSKCIFEPEWPSTHKCTIHWMPIVTRLSMNPN